MTRIVQADPPAGSLIADFAAMEGYYLDAFHIRVPGRVDLPEFIAAFYATPLFRAERFILTHLARAPSSDAQLQALADGTGTSFAAWQVEGRRADEIVLGDTSGRTKSWLHVIPDVDGTVLWFGSVVVPVMRRGRPTLGPVFETLLGAHKVYSRLLLGAAARGLR